MVRVPLFASKKSNPQDAVDPEKVCPAIFGARQRWSYNPSQ